MWGTFMEYSIDQQQESVIVKLQGEFLAKYPSSFRKLLDTIMNIEASQYIFDIENVSFIDSGGLGMLLLAQDTLHSKNRTLIIRHPKNDVKKTLLLANFEKILTIEF